MSRESNAREITITAIPHDLRLRYVLAVVFVAAAVVIRLVFLQGLGNRVLAIALYPAVLLATLYGNAGRDCWRRSYTASAFSPPPAGWTS